ncbi:MAG: hypothetical protein R2710_00385 [Acidimicrobiales bacterium]
MARKKQGGGRTTPKKTTDSPPPLDPRRGFDAAASAGDEFDEGDLALFRSIRMAIDANPIELLGLASAFVDSNDQRAESMFDASERADDEVIDQLLELAGLEARETDALAIAVASLLRTDALEQVRERIGATDWLPTWLRRIDDATVEHGFELVDVLGDADQLTLEVRFPGGKVFSIVVLIDNNQGVVVTDGFAVPMDLDDLSRVIDEGLEDGMSRRPLDLAVARARIAEAIDLGFNTVPPYETDTWPDIRPLTEWVLGRLPEGGVAPLVEPLTRAASKALTEDFLRSPHAADLGDAHLPCSSGSCGSRAALAPTIRCAGARCRSRCSFTTGYRQN